MNSLRVRFAIGFSILFTVFLAIAFLIVYVSYADFRKEEFYSRLKDKALTTFKLLIEVEQVDRELLQVIDKNTLNSLYDEKVLVFEGAHLIYSSLDDKEIRYDQQLLSMVKLEKELHTVQNENELVALYIEQNHNSYTLLASAYDKYGRRKMSFLKWVLLIVYFAGLALGWMATYLFVKNVLRPLYVLKDNLQKVTSDNLHTRLTQSGQGEEVDSLAASFNQMMERLQQAFSIQKDFVHYASHELRTPITAMVSMTENALSKKCRLLNMKRYWPACLPNSKTLRPLPIPCCCFLIRTCRRKNTLSCGWMSWYSVLLKLCRTSFPKRR
ncbi:HAMP domain-containing protein [Paraflavitalea speifideaquila]|uniref:HAMP domain-containing protein n=1 Tax=Paraflavitalea speifideaquila TaxID=3076558 RepID=UPI0028E57FF6|nr:HAMP domain-containing protein [Paraflavitalea speifideiaquila]